MSKNVIIIDKIKPWIEEIVEKKVIELIGDPDYGLELRADVRKRLKKSLASKKKSIPAEKVAKELKLKW